VPTIETNEGGCIAFGQPKIRPGLGSFQNIALSLKDMLPQGLVIVNLFVPKLVLVKDQEPESSVDRCFDDSVQVGIFLLHGFQLFSFGFPFL